MIVRTRKDHCISADIQKNEFICDYTLNMILKLSIPTMFVGRRPILTFHIRQFFGDS